MVERWYLHRASTSTAFKAPFPRRNKPCVPSTHSRFRSNSALKMNATPLFILLGLFCVCNCQSVVKVSRSCRKEGGNNVMTAQVDLDGDVYQYITFLDSSRNRLRGSCGTEDPSEFSGSGTTENPFTIKVTVSPNTGISSPDCGHTAVGNQLTWTLLLVHTLGPSAFTFGRENEYTISCDFDTITENPNIGITVNETEITRVNLTQTSLALEFLIIRENLVPYGPGETYNLGDLVRLRIRALDGVIVGLYGFNCDICNTATCDDLVFPMFDKNGCKTPAFTDILGSSSKSTQPSYLGTYMIGHLVIGQIDFSRYAGMAFTEEFTLPRFVGSHDVFFTCNIGYCDDPAHNNCVEHCKHVLGIQRKKRSVAQDRDHMVAWVRVEGYNESLMIGYPTQDKLDRKPDEVEDCFEKPEYISVLAGLGTLVLGTSVLAMAFGFKISRNAV